MGQQWATAVWEGYPKLQLLNKTLQGAQQRLPTWPELSRAGWAVVQCEPGKAIAKVALYGPLPTSLAVHKQILRAGLWAFLQLPPPLHACAMLCVAPKLGRSVLASLFRPEAVSHGVADYDGVLMLKRGMALLEVIGHVSFNQRVWSRMNNPVHQGGGQSRLISHHNTESYF